MIHITLAGQPTIRAGSLRIDRRHLRGPQAHLAFGVLVMGRNGGVHRDELADVLWPGRLPVTWESALRLVISRVRAFLAAAGIAQTSALASSSGTYRLHLPADAVVDVEAAAAALAAAELAADLSNWGDAERHATSAHVTLSEPFLAGCDAPWVMRERERLQRVRVRALEIISLAALADGRPAAAVAAAGEVIRHEPYRESAHRILIESHMAAGQRTEALSAYAQCRQLLVEHLGVDPSPPTEALYRRVVEESEVPAGRRSECHVLSGAWAQAQSGRTEIVLVSGEAGSGKSHLLAWFADVAARDGALLVTDGIDDADRFVAWLVARASEGPVVIVVDDIHEAGPAARRVVRLLARTPRSVPVLIVAADRAPTPTPAAAVARITLEPLSEAGTAELATAIGVDAGPRQIAEVHVQSGGNVRLATALLRSGTHSVDPALRAVVDRHLSGLSNEALQLLTAAAGVGRQFDVGTVQEQLALDEETVLDALDELIAARLTAPVPGQADTCAFTQPIVRSVLAAPTVELATAD